LEWKKVHADKELMDILGCTHSGMINITDHIINKTRKEELHTILGGTHLDFSVPEHLAGC
jgi:7,8-dihydropterin-6-yl-methyl-4-(beta-D-ribofuranosyl)aminobenzene 5'-phosphate synthase